jgi:hypothetical protein
MHAIKRTRILGPTLASLGARMGTPTDSLKTGKDGQETGKEKPHAAMRGACSLANDQMASQ